MTVRSAGVTFDLVDIPELAGVVLTALWMCCFELLDEFLGHWPLAHRAAGCSRALFDEPL
jgi:hypothetical protein